MWSLLDRRRENYAVLHKWFHLFIRFALAASMFEYGMTKLLLTQFPRPPLATLVTPVSNLSLSALLWTSIGASPGYETFTGFAELLGGLLLLAPRTTTLGALICLADLTQVFVLNMTYDIGVKQISFHLALLSLLLLAPDSRRLANFFFLDRPADRSTQPQLFHSPGQPDRVYRSDCVRAVSSGDRRIHQLDLLASCGAWKSEIAVVRDMECGSALYRWAGSAPCSQRL